MAFRRLKAKERHDIKKHCDVKKRDVKKRDVKKQWPDPARLLLHPPLPRLIQSTAQQIQR